MPEFEMVLVLLLLGGGLVSFVKEWVSPDITAMTLFCLLLISGILTTEEAFSVFSNYAPITIAAMFIITSALERTGSIDVLGHWMARRLGSRLSVVLLGSTLMVAFPSAFLNNTPVVAIFMPVMLGLAREKGIAASKLLIPLSYASIMGGSCTLIGTSTNILVSGIARQHGMVPLGMFELGAIAFPLMVVGLVYIVLVGPWMLPSRETITSILSPEERRRYLCQVLVKRGSPMVGKLLVKTAMGGSASDFRLIEVRRQGRTLTMPLNKIRVRVYDRILISAADQHMIEKNGSGHTLREDVEESFGIECLSTINGSIIEAAVAERSGLIGKTIRQVGFRQTYGALILAVHRRGRNLSEKFLDERLEFGDTLLMLGSQPTFADLRARGDFVMLEDHLPVSYKREKAPLVWGVLALVVVLSAFHVMPIVAASVIGCLVVVLSRCLEPREAYDSVDWSIVFLIYGMLAVGLAMEKTGTASFIAQSGVGVLEMVAHPMVLPFLALSLCYLLTNVLTEVLSNNATAVVMAPVAISFADRLGLDPRPFVVAVAIAASAAFLTPIGYQTNTMVYGVGGYRFMDFVKFGLPLNLFFWVSASILIPLIWPF